MDQDTFSEAKPRLPASVTHFGLNLVGLASILGTLFFLRTRSFSLQDDVFALLAAAAVPIVALDVLVLRVHRRASTGLDWDKPFTPDYGRVATKLLGLAVTVGLIALAYWAFSEYHGSFYDPFYRALRRFWLPLVVGAPTYVVLVDGVDDRAATTRTGSSAGPSWAGPGDANGRELANHFRTWLVKAFFLPLMLVWMHGESRNLIRFDFSSVDWSNLRLYDFLYSLIFGVDLILATVGYVLSFRVIDTHVRSAEPTMFGWVVALFCYQPFYGLMEAQFVRYSNDYGFGSWLSPWPALRWVWAGAIVAAHHDLHPRHGGLRRALLEPHAPRHPHERPVPLHEAPGVHREEHLVVARLDPVRAAHRHRSTRSGTRCCSAASTRSTSCARKTEERHLSRDPDVRRVRALDERPRRAALSEPADPGAQVQGPRGAGRGADRGEPGAGRDGSPALRGPGRPVSGRAVNFTRPRGSV